MLHDKEFNILNCSSFRRFLRNDKINKHSLIRIWVGKDLLSYEGNIINSIPIDPMLPLHEYVDVLCSFRYGEFPSDICDIFKKYDQYYLAGGLSFIKIQALEEIYIYLCKEYGLETKTIIGPEYYCNSCGIPLQYQKLSCWACEHGI